MSEQALSDSSGVPWQGRHLEQNDASNDDGSAPPELLEILRQFRSGAVGQADVVDVLRRSRLLVPLLAELAPSVASDGATSHKSAELAIVTVAAPDGRRVLPVFSSVDAMHEWNAAARPVPSDAVRVALAAASEETNLIVLDPTSVTEFVLRRPAIWAIAQQLEWAPGHLDEQVLAEFARASTGETNVVGLNVASGDPEARLSGPELTVTLTVAPGLGRIELSALLARLKEGWATSELIAARVDSLAVRVLPA